MTASIALLTGCVMHPVARTFYEPDITEGHVHGGSCNYIRTHSAIWRDIGGARLDIGFADEPAGHEPMNTLDLSLSISAPVGAVQFDPHRLRLTVGDRSETLEPAFIDQLPEGLRDRGGAVIQSYTISFPHPAHNATDVIIEVLPGAFAIAGVPQAMPPFHFRRVTKSDLYFESSRC